MSMIEKPFIAKENVEFPTQNNFSKSFPTPP
jgi:hypothetical protein